MISFFTFNLLTYINLIIYMISLNSSSFNFQIEKYKFNKYENVLKYDYVHVKPLLNVYIETNIQNIDNNEKEIYYIFDCPAVDAFAHWVFESFIFYNYFLQINQLHSNVKIVVSNKKKYVKNFFKLFNIENIIIDNIQSFNNICYFSPILSLNDLNIDSNLFITLINNFAYDIMNYKINNLPNVNNIIYLPRNTKDNYVPNDYIIIDSDIIEENVINFNGTILNTYQINNLNLQFSIINSFNTIILNFGSSFLVNCIFLKNKKIIILNYNGMMSQIYHYPSINILFNYIKNNNIIIVINSKNNTFDFNDIKEFL